MARARRQPAEPGFRSDSSSGNGSEIRVTEYAVEGAREFVTVGPEHRVWAGGAFPELPPAPFVRIEPPEGAGDEEVRRLRDACVESGALRVIVLPRRRAAVVREERERRPHRRAREVVLELLAETAFEDREALSTFVEEVMARRGL